MSQRSDTTVLVLSIFAVLIAAVISMATISTRSADSNSFDSSDPYDLAEDAAEAGLKAAKWHMECHGRTLHGGLAEQYYVNGALYDVEWDDVNPNDSTAAVRSRGIFREGKNQDYVVRLQSRVKLEFLPSHRNEILSSYYDQNRAHTDYFVPTSQ